ncbi:MAG TPA: GNAT family N-acetyltransferase [Gemmatimonadales bacterium]|jgi:ribosomal protein S18 acetylase RimI-like enzyme|nr:GNAT family N-acetyltransferase [Gemmatimonadales bacterium]
MLKILRANSAEELDGVRTMILAHAAALRDHKGADGVLVDAKRLPGPYTPPLGGLYLAMLNGKPVGCVALQPLDEVTGEVKRMFVLATARRRGIARALMERLLDDARAAGYRRIRLGTLDEMTAAQLLYQALGFVRIPRYRQDEEVDTMFFECDLG